MKQYYRLGRVFYNSRSDVLYPLFTPEDILASAVVGRNTVEFKILIYFIELLILLHNKIYHDSFRHLFFVIRFNLSIFIAFFLQIITTNN